MHKINWKIRFKSPQFWIGLAGVIASPVLAYFGARPEDLTTWEGIGQMVVQTVQNPFLLGSIAFAVLGFLGVTVDPTTKGISDSRNALDYSEPR